MTMMKTTFSRIATPILFAVTIALGACKRGDKPEDALAQDTSLAHDLSLANADTMAQPQLKDVPITTAPIVNPAAPAPRVAKRQTPSQILTPSRNPRRVVSTTPRTPEPAEKAPVTTENGNTVTEGSSAGTAPSRSVGTIATGSEISLYSGQRVCTNTYAVGDRFTASVAESVQGSNGVAIPAGATAVIEVTALKKVATGAVIGAIAGQIFGHHTKSTVIGAATGAAAGAVVAGATGKYDGCVPNGGRISLKLTQPMQVQQSV